MRRRHSEQLLDNEQLSGAFTALGASYISVSRATVIDDVAGREKLFLAINIVGQIAADLAASEIAAPPGSFAFSAERTGSQWRSASAAQWGETSCRPAGINPKVPFQLSKPLGNA
jgi:hypothetical protein